MASVMAAYSISLTDRSIPYNLNIFSTVLIRTRDELQCGPCYQNEETMYPDFFLAIKSHAVAIMEAKAPNRGAAGYKDDRRKLLDQMKLSIDGLLNSGVSTSVVGFQMSGKFVFICFVLAILCDVYSNSYYILLLLLLL